jgi:membrane protein DedA with SNARE-associated domain
VAYWAGSKGGRPLIEKYGRYVLVSRHDLDLADRWFANYGEIIVFVSRLLPAIRTFISFPAGVARMNLKRFGFYTFAGSLPWCLGLAYVGQKLGEKWNQDDTLKTWFHRFDFVIGIVAVLLAAWWIWRHIKHLRKEKQA